MAHALTWLDVFTDRPLTGNGLAVVHDADGVADATMLAFAKETRLSETSFVQSASESRADYRNRIWMTQRELPFAGHPSLGTAVAVARARGEREATYVQQTGAGLQSVEVEAGERVARASMAQEPATFGPEVDPAVVFRALGLTEADGAAELAPQVVGTGLTHLIVPVRKAGGPDRVRAGGGRARPGRAGRGRAPAGARRRRLRVRVRRVRRCRRRIGNSARLLPRRWRRARGPRDRVGGGAAHGLRARPGRRCPPGDRPGRRDGPGEPAAVRGGRARARGGRQRRRVRGDRRAVARVHHRVDAAEVVGRPAENRGRNPGCLAPCVGEREAPRPVRERPPGPGGAPTFISSA